MLSRIESVAGLLKRFEGDDGVGVLNAFELVDLLVYEMANIGIIINVEFDQQIVITGCGIDFRGNFSGCYLARNLIGLAELAFDLNEKRLHEAIRFDFCAWVIFTQLNLCREDQKWP